MLCHQHDCDQARSAVESPSVSQRPLHRGRGEAHACRSVQQGAGMKCKRVRVERTRGVGWGLRGVSAHAIVTATPQPSSDTVSPPSSHFSGGLAFLARRGSSQVVVLLL